MSKNGLFLFCLGFMLGMLSANIIYSSRGYTTHSYSDTLVVVNTDTIHDTIPLVKNSRIVDTIYITRNEESIPLPREQKHYSKPQNYDVWVSGYQPTLDSVKTYKNTVYRTITNNLVTEVEKKRMGIYPYVGINSCNGNVGGKVGLTITTRGRFAFGGEVGVLHNNVFYGAHVAFKVN